MSLLWEKDFDGFEWRLVLMITKGTKEWADSNLNFQKGCKNGCLYCYAAQMAIRFKRCQNLEEWTNNISFNKKNLEKNYRKRKGRIMFPTAHDLTEENYDKTEQILTKLLEAGNEVLITTKPRFEVIKFLIHGKKLQTVNFVSKIRFAIWG